MQSINQLVSLDHGNISLAIKREDLIHPFVSGNKYRKLKYNLVEAARQNHSTLLTFGGAFSNHIAAVAASGQANNFDTIGIIRGDELANKIDSNPTLQFSQDCGMKLEFVSRDAYRHKNEPTFIEDLKKKYGNFYLMPEGGTNDLAVRGCEEILTAVDSNFDYVCCSVGTGGTVAGLINSSANHQKILGFPALKGDYLKEEICRFATNDNWELIPGYEFGGYGKINDCLVEFINSFYKNNCIPLDPIYTGKMVFGVIDLIHKGYFPEGSRILVIHTGGIQGINGMNVVLKSRKSPLIYIND